MSKMRYQGIWRRGIAQVIDIIISFIIFTLIGFSFAPVFNGLTHTGFHLTGLPALIVIFLSGMAVLAYFTILESELGQTLGKLVMKIKVVKEDGSSCDYPSSLIRNALRVVDWLPFLYIIGVVFITRSEPKQRLGDLFAGTVVIEKP